MDLGKIQENIKKRHDEHDRIWNAAIEAAASTIDRLNKEGPMAITGATEIRKLKK